MICAVLGFRTRALAGAALLCKSAVVWAVLAGCAALGIGWRAWFLAGDPGAMKPLMAFRPFALIAKETLTKGSPGAAPVRQLTFALPAGQSLHSLGFDLGLGDFVQVRPPGLLAKARSYSPTSPAKRRGSFDITVKVYTNGVVSGHLDGLAIGEEALISGPAPVPWLALRMHPSPEVGLVAFGVGITEALPVAEAQLLRLLEGGDGGGGGDWAVARVVLLWANRQWVDTFWHHRLAALEAVYGDRFRVVHVLSREEREGCLHSRVTPTVLATVFGDLDRKQSTFLVVGTKVMKRDAYARLKSIGFTGGQLLTKGLRAPWQWRDRSSSRTMEEDE